MENMVVLEIGLGTIGVLSILLAYLMRLKKRLRKFVLRFEKIKDKFD